VADQVTDADLVAAVRAGDEQAYAELYRRHHRAALRFARSLAGRSADVEDLVADAFTRVLAALNSGNGPDEAFRPYLLAAVRSVFCNEARRSTRERPVDELDPLAPSEPFVDPVLAGDERRLIATAFSELPERWQVVLWHTAVEGERPATVARLLGISANAVAALAYRAREGLRENYLQAHLGSTGDGQCHATVAQLGAYTRHNLSKAGEQRVRGHLDGCSRCRVLFTDLADVNSRLSAVVGPVVLGAAAAGYLTSGFGVVGRMLHESQAAAAVTVAASISAVVLAVGGGSAPPTDTPRPAPARAVAAAPAITPDDQPDSSSSAPTPRSSQRHAVPPGALHAAGPVDVTASLKLRGLGRGKPGVIKLSITHPKGRPDDAASDVVLTLTLPAGIALRKAKAGNGWTCSAGSADITCRRAGLSPGHGTVAAIHVQVSADAASGIVSAHLSVPGSPSVTVTVATPY
jgi:RNA polymerase sigma factor (sigma-70 family)